MKVGFVKPAPESSAVEKPDMESPADPSVKNSTSVEFRRLTKPPRAEAPSFDTSKARNAIKAIVKRLLITRFPLAITRQGRPPVIT